jgi:DNA mismatch endonuclease (patch repair protein)
MPDNLQPHERSRLMSHVHGKDTKPEKVLRSFLHSMGYRFRLHKKELPGSPDLVLTRYKTIVFVHRCFWHRHPGCKKASTPKDNAAFWQNKFQQNVERDQRKERELEALGWRVIVVWQCETEPRNIPALQARMSDLLDEALVIAVSLRRNRTGGHRPTPD